MATLSRISISEKVYDNEIELKILEGQIIYPFLNDNSKKISLLKPQIIDDEILRNVALTGTKYPNFLGVSKIFSTTNEFGIDADFLLGPCLRSYSSYGDKKNISLPHNFRNSRLVLRFLSVTGTPTYRLCTDGYEDVPFATLVGESWVLNPGTTLGLQIGGNIWYLPENTLSSNFFETTVLLNPLDGSAAKKEVGLMFEALPMYGILRPENPIERQWAHLGSVLMDHKMVVWGDSAMTYDLLGTGQGKPQGNWKNQSHSFDPLLQLQVPNNSKMDWNVGFVFVKGVDFLDTPAIRQLLEPDIRRICLSPCENLTERPPLRAIKELKEENPEKGEEVKSTFWLKFLGGAYSAKTSGRKDILVSSKWTGPNCNDFLRRGYCATDEGKEDTLCACFLDNNTMANNMGVDISKATDTNLSQGIPGVLSLHCLYTDCLPGGKVVPYGTGTVGNCDTFPNLQICRFTNVSVSTSRVNGSVNVCGNEDNGNDPVEPIPTTVTKPRSTNNTSRTGMIATSASILFAVIVIACVYGSRHIKRKK